MKKGKDEQIPLAGTEEEEILVRLGEKVERAIATITELRRKRDSLKKRPAEVETTLRDREHEGERLATIEEEHERFRRERGEIRERIETILSNLESLDTAEPAEE